MNPDLVTTFCRPVAALAFAGVTYIADTATPEIPGVPQWLTSLGLPVAFLVAVIYALVATNKALRASETGRRQDWGGYADKLEMMMLKENESRERLIRATDLQTTQFQNLAEQLKCRPCQK